MSVALFHIAGARDVALVRQRDRKRAAFAYARCGLNERITRDAGLSIQQRDLPDPLQ